MGSHEHSSASVAAANRATAGRVSTGRQAIITKENAWAPPHLSAEETAITAQPGWERETPLMARNRARQAAYAENRAAGHEVRDPYIAGTNAYNEAKRQQPWEQTYNQYSGRLYNGLAKAYNTDRRGAIAIAERTAGGDAQALRAAHLQAILDHLQAGGPLSKAVWESLTPPQQARVRETFPERAPTEAAKTAKGGKGGKTGKGASAPTPAQASKAAYDQLRSVLNVHILNRAFKTSAYRDAFSRVQRLVSDIESLYRAGSLDHNMDRAAYALSHAVVTGRANSDVSRYIKSATGTQLLQLVADINARVIVPQNGDMTNVGRYLNYTYRYDNAGNRLSALKGWEDARITPTEVTPRAARPSAAPKTAKAPRATAKAAGFAIPRGKSGSGSYDHKRTLPTVGKTVYYQGTYDKKPMVGIVEDVNHKTTEPTIRVRLADGSTRDTGATFVFDHKPKMTEGSDTYGTFQKLM